MSIIQDTAQKLMQTAARLAPDALVPGGKPDPLIDRPGGLIGTPVSRIDGAHKVQGRAHFAAEFPLDGMAYAALVYSTIPKGRIAAIDTSEAEAAPGVVLVMTHHNAPRMKPMPLFLNAPKAAAGEGLPVLQDDAVHYNGQPVALVLAETQEQADHARSLVRVDYEAAPAVTSLAAARAKGSEPGKFLGESLKQEFGDAEAALAAAPHKVDAVYRTPRYNHNAIELHGVTVAWESEDSLRIHDSTQAVAHTAWSMAEVFGLKEEQVRVTSPYVGGGFGGKAMWRHHVLAVAASQLAGRPVRLALSREGVYRVVGGRSLTEQRVALGARADGRFEALIHTGLTAMTPHNNFPEPFILPSQCVYAAANIKLDVEAVRMDALANTFMRAPGEAVGTFALESAVDELAEALGMDPIELRLANEPHKDPTKGTPISSRHLDQAYRHGAERFGWRARQAPGMRRDGEWLVGLGCATATYPYHRMPGGAARITLSSDGRALVEFAAHEMGMGTATTHLMVAAERLGLPMDRIKVCYGDSAMPGLILAGGSQQTASVGHSLIAAQHALVKALLDLAGRDSPLHGLKPDEVEARAGGLCKQDEPQRFASYVDLLAHAGRDSLAVEGSAPPPLEAEHWSMHSFGAIFCEARVNLVTGEPRVTRLLGAYDCGRIINPKTAASQFRGGMIMGMGMALMEETQVDERNGRIMNPSLSEYHVPVHLDVPEIEVMWTDIPDPHAPMGARGIGEIGITGTSAAIVNAIYNACGKRVRELPVTLDKLLET
jgi:xanthine dehydrogenase YagR molybdenum-binding subunit